MNKWFFVFVLILLLFGICGIVSHFAAPPLVSTTQYGMELRATAAAATPDTTTLLSQNRASLAETGTGSGSGAWAGFAIFLMVAVLLGLVIAILLAATPALKQGRLVYKMIGKGGSPARRPHPGRVRTIPQIPSISSPQQASFAEQEFDL